VNELSNEQREALETRAIQKFRDFIDYLKIISDPKITTDLKNHSKGLAMDLFVSDSTTVTDSSFKNTTNSMVLSAYLEKISIHKKSLVFLVEETHFQKPTEEDTRNNLIGVVNSRLIANGKKISKRVDVFLIDIAKSFGDSTLSTNEVRLGNIY
jgi:hypothetical protein